MTTQVGYTWRQSSFARIVLHYTPNDSEQAVCTQTIVPNTEDEPGSIECPECLIWIRRNKTR